ncbi:MAG: phosphatidate cytidylyltransferase [Deltaproteobacteria bacterium]|jgi:phosphatidate cytidylyltransferase|nr:phosphatidate cytidylyltransferase [Deltaproteobacteria bacterium]
MALGETHLKRVLSGFAMLAALAAGLLTGGWPLRALICIVAALALWEFYQMFWPGFSRLPDKAVGLITGVLLCLYSPCSLAVSMALLGFLSFYAALRFLFTYGHSDEKISANANLSDGALLIFGVIYFPLCLQLALQLELLEQLAVLLVAICSDTGAYYAGSLLGRHKIWPKVSPKKSLEGALGGLCATMLFLTVYSRFINIPWAEAFSIQHFALLGLILSVFAQLGDFFESALKRCCNIKDSSNLIPGHGGLMDRLDSIVFVLPIYIFIRTLCISYWGA